MSSYIIIVSLFLSMSIAPSVWAAPMTTTPLNTQNNVTPQIQLPAQNVMDFQLNAKIQQQLRTQLPGFNPENYTIYSQYGQVTIQARVKNKSEAESVMRLVRNVSGVTGINNTVVVDPNM